jgi:multisubunit Na+/H+ antiporter MnhG subunit
VSTGLGGRKFSFPEIFAHAVPASRATSCGVLSVGCAVAMTASNNRKCINIIIIAIIVVITQSPSVCMV